jgi:hypothetical protein
VPATAVDTGGIAVGILENESEDHRVEGKDEAMKDEEEANDGEVTVGIETDGLKAKAAKLGPNSEMNAGIGSGAALETNGVMEEISGALLVDVVMSSAKTVLVSCTVMVTTSRGLK